MFTPFFRLLLVLVNLVLVIFFFLREDFLSMFLILISTGLFVYGYFRYGTVYLAFQQLKKENYDKSEKLISKIKNPSMLSANQKSYYHFAQGIIASNKRDWDKSASDLNKALTIGLRTENDISIALLNLANVEFERKNFEKAIELIKKIKKFDLNSLVRSELDKLEHKINKEEQKV